MIKNLLRKSLFLRQVARNYRLKTSQSPWGSILEKNKSLWHSALNSSKAGPKVLIAPTAEPELVPITLTNLLVSALTLRKIEIHILLCDTVLSACFNCMLGINISEKCLAQFGPQKDLCRACFYFANKTFQPFGLKIHRYSEFLSEEDIMAASQVSMDTDYSKIKDYTLNNLNIGEHAMAGALRFYARGTLEGDFYAEIVLRRYFKAALLTTLAVQRLLEKYQFECVVCRHGIYVPEGLIGEVCRSRNVRVVNWNIAYRKSCFIFSHNDTYHHTLMSEPVSKWDNLNMNPKLEKELKNYLKSRWYGTHDWIRFYEKPEVNIDTIVKVLGVDFSKPCIGMLTNVIWDAQLHYPTNLFTNMLDWIMQTISYFEKRPDLQLVIRIHPAEVHGAIPSRQPVLDEIKKSFPVLSNNIFIIPPESHISSYLVMLKCNSVIIYGTKTGVELACMGIPVIVVGEAWIRNKGMTIDPKTKEEYFHLLDKLPFSKGMSDILILRAHKYAYHFFARRMIPVEFIKNLKLKSECLNQKVSLKSLGDLLPSKNIGLDIICDGIIYGKDFIYPAEDLSWQA